MVKTVKTFLPVFSGFNESIWDYECLDEEKILDSINYIRAENGKKPLSTEDFEIEIDKELMFGLVANHCCREVFPLVSNFCNRIVYEKYIEAVDLYFQEDTVHIAVDITEDHLQKIKEYIGNNFPAFTQYISCKYTSKEGYVSAYSNNSIDWYKKFKFENIESLQHEIGSVFAFIIRNEKGEKNEYAIEKNIAEKFAEGNTYEYIENYDYLINI